MKTLRGFVYLNGTVFLLYAASYLYQLLSSRILSVEEYGLWSAFNSFYLIAYIPGAALNLLVARRVAELSTSQSSHVREYVIRTSRLLALLLSGWLPVVFLAPLIHKILPSASPMAIVLLGLASMSALACPLPYGVLQGVQQLGMLGAGYLVRGCVMLLTGGVLLKLGLGLDAALAGLAIGNLASLAVTAAAVFRVLRAASGESRLTPAPRAGSEYFILTTATFALTTLMPYLDTLLARTFLGPETAGYYGTIAVAGRTVNFVPTALAAIIVPRVAARAVAGKDTRHLLLWGLAATLVVSVPVVAVFTAAPRLVLGIFFGPIYGASPLAPLLAWYAVAATFFNITSLLVYYFMSRRQLLYLVGLAAGLLTLVANLVFIHATASDLIRAIVLGNGVSALLLVALAVAGAPVRSAHRAPTPAPVPVSTGKGGPSQHTGG